MGPVGDAKTAVESILKLVRNFQGLSISAADVHKLSMETVVPIYVEFLKTLGTDDQNLWKPWPSETQRHLMYYDADNRFIMKLYSEVALILKHSCRMLEFDLADILQPELNRTAVIFSVFDNIISSESWMKEEIDDIVKHINERTERERKLADLKEKLRIKINQQSKHKAELSILDNQLTNQINEAEHKIFTAFEEKQKVAESLEPVNKVLAEYDHKISILHTESIKLEQTVGKLKNQIVSSEQLIHEQETLKAEEQELKESESEIQKNFQQKKAQCEKHTSCACFASATRKEVTELQKLIDGIRNEEMVMKQLEMEAINLSEKVCVKKEVCGMTTHTKVEHDQEKKSLEDQLADKMKKAKKKIVQLEKALAQSDKATKEHLLTIQDLAKDLEDWKNKTTKERKRQGEVLQDIGYETENTIQEVKDLSYALNDLRQFFEECYPIKTTHH